MSCKQSKLINFAKQSFIFSNQDTYNSCSLLGFYPATFVGSSLWEKSANINNKFVPLLTHYFINYNLCTQYQCLNARIITIMRLKVNFLIANHRNSPKWNRNQLLKGGIHKLHQQDKEMSMVWIFMCMLMSQNSKNILHYISTKKITKM